MAYPYEQSSIHAIQSLCIPYKRLLCTHERVCNSIFPTLYLSILLHDTCTKLKEESQCTLLLFSCLITFWGAGSQIQTAKIQQLEQDKAALLDKVEKMKAQAKQRGLMTTNSSFTSIAIPGELYTYLYYYIYITCLYYYIYLPYRSLIIAHLLKSQLLNRSRTPSRTCLSMRYPKNNLVERKFLPIIEKSL